MQARNIFHGPGKELKLKNCPAATGVDHSSKGTKLLYSKRCFSSDVPWVSAFLAHNKAGERMLSILEKIGTQI